MPFLKIEKMERSFNSSLILLTSTALRWSTLSYASGKEGEKTKMGVLTLFAPQAKRVVERSNDRVSQFPKSAFLLLQNNY
jgi:hypothetical protein